MRRNMSLFALLTLTTALNFCGVVLAQTSEPTVLARYEDQTSSAHAEPAQMAGKPGIAVVFTGTDDLHYYAKAETAAGGYNLTITAQAESVTFGTPVFPQWVYFRDLDGSNVEVYVGDFSVFVPIDTPMDTISKLPVAVTVSGIACTSKVCLPPFEQSLQTTIDPSQAASWPQISIEQTAHEETQSKDKVVEGASYTTPIALILAVVVGLMFNIMPCVLPVIPLIITRLLDQAKQGRSRSMALGAVFCGGIIAFFAALAVFNIVLQLVYGRVFQWGDHFRNPAFVMAMSLLMMVLGLFMFDVFTIGVPSSVAGKAGGGKGAGGAFGMGFLAALLSTPCSFGVLAGIFAWAQTQPLPLSTLAFILMGVGMAIPYAVLVSMPSLLARLPRPGTWMEIVRKAMGFVLLVIAVKLLGALPRERLINVLYYSLVLSFALWMWGGWVNFATATGRKWAVRIAALVIAISAGWALLPEKTKLVDWQDYDPAMIAQAREEGTPILIKFTADWCTTCSWVDKAVYQRKNIADLIEQKGILAVKGDTTLASEQATIDLADTNKYNEPGVPVTVLHLPDSQDVHLRGVISRQDLKEVLDDLPDR